MTPEQDAPAYESVIRVRMSAADAYYGGGLVNGARTLALFGDIATELAIMHDGDEGLLVGYESVEFLAPVYAGDFIEARGRITRVGTTSRRIEFAAWKVITARPEISDSAADLLPQRQLVCRAIGTTVVRREHQRRQEQAPAQAQ